MQGVQEADREVVRDHRPREPPGIPQQPGQQGRVGRHRDPVHVGVGVHHRPDAALPHRHLEGSRHHVEELPRAHRDRRQIPSGTRGGVADEVLQSGDHPGGFEPPDVRRRDPSDQVGILADGLLDPAPAQVAHHVQDGGQPLVNAKRRHVGPDPPSHPLDQIGVESSPPAQRNRIGGRLPGGEPGQALLVGDRRQAQPALSHDPALGAQQRDRADRGVDRRGAERTGELAQPAGQHLVQVDRVGHLVLVRRDVLAVPGGAHPQAVELGDFLGHGHLGDQRFDPIVEGKRGVMPRPGGGGLGHGGHPFTAPVRPPTMRFSAAMKNSSAGSIDSEV